MSFVPDPDIRIFDQYYNGLKSSRTSSASSSNCSPVKDCSLLSPENSLREDPFLDLEETPHHDQLCRTRSSSASVFRAEVAETDLPNGQVQEVEESDTPLMSTPQNGPNLPVHIPHGPPLIETDSSSAAFSPDLTALFSPLAFLKDKTPTNIPALQRSSLSWDQDRTPTNNARHSFGSDGPCGSVDSSGSSDLQRAIFERLPSFQMSVAAPDGEESYNEPIMRNNTDHRAMPRSNPLNPGHRPITRSNPDNLTSAPSSDCDLYPSPTLPRLRRSFPSTRTGSRPLSGGDPLIPYNVIPPSRKDSYLGPTRRQDSYFSGGDYSDSDEDRSGASGYAGSEDGSEEDYFSDMEGNTARSLYFMAYEVKRRLSTIPAGLAGNVSFGRGRVGDPYWF